MGDPRHRDADPYNANFIGEFSFKRVIFESIWELIFIVLALGVLALRCCLSGIGSVFRLNPDSIPRESGQLLVGCI